MKTYNYTEEQQNLSVIFNTAEKEDVIIKRQDGLRFKLVCMKETAGRSPFDVPGVTTNISTQEIIDILRDSREQ
jgi:hypothetical protein